MTNEKGTSAGEGSSELHIDTTSTPESTSDGRGTLTMTDMMVSAVDQLPQYALGQPIHSSATAPTAAASTASDVPIREVKDPIYAPFLPSDMTSTSGDGTATGTSFSFSSPSDIGPSASSSRPSAATRSRMQPLSLNTDVPSPMYSLTPPSATAGGGVSVTAPLSPFTEVDIAEWKRGTEPFVEASANMDDDGQIDVSIEVRGPNKPLPPIPMSPSTSHGGPSSPAWSPMATSMTTMDTSVSSQSQMPSLASASQPSGTCKRKSKGKKKATTWYEGTVPVMNIVIFIVGSRGDVQPYIALALALITTHGHRVRIATHPDFEQFVLSANTRLKGQYHQGVPLEGRLEFFNAGGDPKSLMEYMVKNPGLLPGFDSIKNGDIGKKQRMTADMLRGFYRSTFCPDIQSGREFAADAIISNPPAFAHIHVAEALGIPLHMSFTMPWTATTSFPHPLVNVSRSNADKSLTNWMGYGLADILMWQGLGGQINLFRTQDLRIDELPDRVASDLIDRQRIPWTYCWSPELLPKPLDWRGHIDISGFYFLDGDNSYNPPAELTEFLQAGEAPVYIGFGSVVIKDPAAMTDMLFEAIEAAGVRAIISAGWAGLGKGREGTNKDILIWSKDVPHEWLFANDRVSAVMHHGGAGTTACGLRHGRPTIIVPFFGDQKFWGEAVHRAGAGPAPIPIKTVSAELFAAALAATKTEAMRDAAAVLGEKIRSEKGEMIGVESFQRHLPLSDMRCDIDPRRVATLYCPRLSLRLSPEAAGTLLERGRVLSHELEVYRTKEYETTRVLRGPISSTGLAMNNIMTTTVSGVSQLFYSPIKGSIKTFYGVPEVIGDMYEGFQNMPGIMGSTARHTKPVTGFVSGMAEGGKALGFGLWDGIFGLFLDPIDGARREGFAGFGKGLGRGTANLFFRPLAGTLGFFVHPTRGAAQSVKAIFSGPHEPTGVLFSPRLWLAKEAAKKLPASEKDTIVSRLTELEKQAKKRAKERDGGRVFLLANKRERAEEKVLREREKRDRALGKAADQARRAERKRAEGSEGEGDVGDAGVGGQASADRKNSETSQHSDSTQIGMRNVQSEYTGMSDTNTADPRETESAADGADHKGKGVNKGKGKATDKAAQQAAKADKKAQKAKDKQEKQATKLEKELLKKQRKEWEEEKKMMLKQELGRRDSGTGTASGSAATGDMKTGEAHQKGKGRAKDAPTAVSGADGPAVVPGMSQLGLSDPQPAPSSDYSVPKPSWRHSSAFGFRRRSNEVVTVPVHTTSPPTASPQPPLQAPPLPPRRSSKPSTDVSSITESTSTSTAQAKSTSPPSWRANSAFGVPNDGSMAKGRLFADGSVADSASLSEGSSSAGGTWRRGSAFGVPIASSGGRDR